jgi:glycosyltransferase involved in cell wall biosynthesis
VYPRAERLGRQMDKLKILMAHNFYQLPGGEDQCLAAEMAMLKANGHEVIHYTLHNDSIKTLGNVDLLSRTIFSRPAYRKIRYLIQTHRPHVAHFHNTFPLMSPGAYYAARSENVAVVQTLHNYRLLCPNALFYRDGHVCEDCLGRYVPWPGVIHKCYRGSRTASAAVAAMMTVHRMLGTWRQVVDTYIALTSGGRDKLVAGGLPAERIAVKPHFVYPDPGTGPGSGGYGVFVGRLSVEKGLETLLGAWKHLTSNVRLKIVGDGPLMPLVRQAVTADARIEWLGQLAPDRVFEEIGKAAFLVFPSRCYETFGRSAVEAYAKGTPVIASRLGAMAEVVIPGRTGLLFEPGNAVDLASKVLDLLGDESRLLALRQAARQEFEEKYTAEVNYRHLMAIYEQALERKATPLGRPVGVAVC